MSTLNRNKKNENATVRDQETPEKKTCFCCPFLIPSREEFEITQTISSGKDNRIVIPVPHERKCFQTVSLKICDPRFEICHVNAGEHPEDAKKRSKNARKESALEPQPTQELPEEPMCFILKSNFLPSLPREDNEGRHYSCSGEIGTIGTFNEACSYDFDASCYKSKKSNLVLRPGRGSFATCKVGRSDLTAFIVEIVPFTNAYFAPFDIRVTFRLERWTIKLKKQEDGTYQKYTESELSSAKSNGELYNLHFI
jgi:hypothetical protein